MHGVDLGGLATRVLGVGSGSWRGLAKQFPGAGDVSAHGGSLKQPARPVLRLGLVVGVVGIGSDSGRVGGSKSVGGVVVRLRESPSDERRAKACSSRGRLARRRRAGHYCGQLSWPISERVREYMEPRCNAREEGHAKGPRP